MTTREIVGMIGDNAMLVRCTNAVGVPYSCIDEKNEYGDFCEVFSCERANEADMVKCYVKMTKKGTK